MTLILTRSDILAMLTHEETVVAVERAHADLSRGTAVLPAPPAMRLPGADDGAAFLAMAAVSAPDRLATVKLLADLPGNRARGLPVQRSAILAVSAEDGDCTALLDGAAVTRFRTAAASAVATRALARPDARVLGLIGTGPLALAHAQSLRTVWAYDRVVLWGRTGERARELAARIEAEAGVSAEVLAGPREVTEAADVLCTLTPSREPLVRGAWFRPGLHVNAVGAPPRPDHREIDTEGMRRSVVVVDAYDTALAKSGEVVIALAEGAFGPEHVRRELGDVLTGGCAGRTSPEDITLFDSVGVGLQDLAAARLLIDGARARGLGVHIDLAG
ncbi:ornithine cyclodeaminase family protein [uncultured Streptomyces sp.]|uniref:ornithine cyclodeaminase family protein n=1 Tax=uncultured Streptomyces sp. TaxID=174707 RepID=UPI002627FA6F|nr:ornithine cyclodeaminase family protein [uncultured Streptomyces sp.]